MPIPISIVSNPSSFIGDEDLFVHSMTVVGVAAQQVYFIPAGDFVFDKLGEYSLTKDGVPQTPLVDYFLFGRTAAGAPGAISVLDLKFGFRMVAPVVGGEVFRFMWNQRVIRKPAYPMMAVYTVGGIPDFTVRWGANSAGGTQPNAVRVPELTGPQYAVEWWRQTLAVGGAPNTGGVSQHQGRRFMPLRRMPNATFLFGRDDVRAVSDAAHNWKRYKWLYRNTVTGAASPLSAQTMRITAKPGDVLTTLGQVRVPFNLWIEE